MALQDGEGGGQRQKQNESPSPKPCPAWNRASRPRCWNSHQERIGLLASNELPRLAVGVALRILAGLNMLQQLGLL